MFMASFSDFLNYCRSLQHEHLQTLARNKPFSVVVEDGAITFLPLSSHKPRKGVPAQIESVLSQLSKTGSYSPSHYQSITYHSSYILAVAQRYSGEIQTCAPHNSNIRLTNRLHQRIGSISNAHVGAEFEKAALLFFEKKGEKLTRNFPLELGVCEKKKTHCFDLGSANPKIIIECKSHKWTAGGKVPSAKMITWNEAMLYFHLAPKDYKKVFFTLHDKRHTTGETLVAYYKRTYHHLIPKGVEFLEYDESTGDIIRE